MRVTSTAFLDYVLERLEVVGHISVRAMFGGHGIYYKGVMIALVAYDELYFKVDESNIQRFKEANSKPFTYAGKQDKTITMSYWRLPEDVLEEDEQLMDWVQSSYVAAKKGKE